jgi:LPXTG-motif cell wall-anchored protein
MKIICLAIMALMLLPIVLAAEKDDILASLNEFYAAGKSEDVDRYYNSQDSLYLNLLGDKESIKGYFAGTFAQFDTLSYEIVSPKFEISGTQAMVFYELKAKIKLTDGEEKSIDNDMVAFLWKYDSWKVRYTILRSLYEEKLIDSVASLAAMDVLFRATDNVSIQQEMEAQGLYKFDEAAYAPPKHSQPWLLYAGIVLMVLLVGGYFILKKRK